MTSATGRRLQELRNRGHQALAPLWIESLSAEEALELLRDRHDPVSRLQKAHFLMQLGRTDESLPELQQLVDLTPGLEAVRQRLLGRATTEAPSRDAIRDAFPGGIATKTLAELYLAQGDVETAVATYKEILDREPWDEVARARMRELMGIEPAGIEAVLGAWLENVRRWRRALHV